MNEQQWQESRLGRFTASEIHRLLTEPTVAEKKAGEKLSKGAKTFCEEVASEIFTGQPFQDSSTFATIRAAEWGKLQEPIAVEKYKELIYKGDEASFKYYGGGNYSFFEIGENAGYSPDFIADVYGEVKCPDTHTHIKYTKLRNNEDLKDFKAAYYYQMQMGMMGHKLETGHFVSFDPRMVKASLFVLTIKKDNEAQDLILSKLEAARDYVRDIITDINDLSNGKQLIYIR